MTETPTAADLDTALDAVARQVTAKDCYDAAEAGGYEVASLVERGVRVAVPVAVAAELRRIAGLDPSWTICGPDTFLRARADVLDPPARQEN